MVNQWLEMYTNIVEAIKYAVIAVDREEKIVLINRAAEEFFLLTREEALGRPFIDVFGPGNEEFQLAGALREGKEIEGREVSLKNRGGEEGLFVINTSLVRNAEGVPMGAMVLLNNVTELRRFEKEIAKADLLAAVSELAAGTAHEIRNPLTTVKGFVQLLGGKFPPGAREHSYLELILSELDRVNRIISNFLMLVKPDPSELQLTGVNYLIQDIMLLVEGQALLQDVQVQCVLGDLPLCLMQPDQVKQVVLNIVRNSLQAMPQGGDLIVFTRPAADGNFVEITVTDTGVGIPPEHLGKILVPFFSSKPEASGLGLTVAHRIVQNHGGKLEVQSEEGKGATVLVRLPVTADLKGSTYS